MALKHSLVGYKPVSDLVLRSAIGQLLSTYSSLYRHLYKTSVMSLFTVDKYFFVTAPKVNALPYPCLLFICFHHAFFRMRRGYKER